MNSRDNLSDSDRPIVMGVLNVTPDSFSDGGRFHDAEAALARAREMAAEGAAIIDVGGESTRPGAEPVTVAEELDRVIPVIEALGGCLDIPVSVDTSKPEVMAAALEAGASMINDVNALRAEGALEIAAAADVPVCLMHMQREPRSMQQAPRYEDVVGEVRSFLSRQLERCRRAGIDSRNVFLDPGFGFGKTLEHNLQLLNNLEQFTDLGAPLMIGISRKSMLGAILGKPEAERLYGGLAAAAVAVLKGVRLIRTHDVAPTVDVVKVVGATRELGSR